MKAMSERQESLYVESFGHGHPLVMLHGWAMHGGIWSSFARELGESYAVHVVDLPGHGYSSHVNNVRGPDEFVQILDRSLADLIEEPFYLIGWSLGGLLALHWALTQPQRIAKLQLIAVNPSFVQHDEWRCGMNPHVLKTFAEQLGEHYEQTLQRFVALQLQGNPEAREHLRSLRRRLFERGTPSAQALQSGLDILLSVDLREHLHDLSMPVQWVLGERDTLVPMQLADVLDGYLPNVDTQVIEGAGHAPFLSHSQSLLKYTKQFFQ